MTWADVIALLISSATAVAVAWIGARQALVRRDLARTNGHVDSELAALRAELYRQGRGDSRPASHSEHSPHA